jgi:magnesium transporter
MGLKSASRASATLLEVSFLKAIVSSLCLKQQVEIRSSPAARRKNHRRFNSRRKGSRFGVGHSGRVSVGQNRHGGNKLILMQPRTTARVSLTALLGTPVTDSQGHLRGRLKDIAVATGPDAGKVAGLVLKTSAGLCIVPSEEVMETPAGTLELRTAGALVPLKDEGNFLFLEQDLMDRQIIDIHGRKVVRVNDVDLEWLGRGAAHLLHVAEVEVGTRGAFRRIFKGVLPRAVLESLSRRLGASTIPWKFVDVIEVDPARRVKLRIEYERLAEMHPSDLAEILEDLAPAEREAVFTSLDEEVAAETLEEVDPKLQKALLEKLDEERIADIVEEMDPGAAADLLAELPEEQSDAILEEMEPEERQEVEELLEFDENSAAGCMTTDFVPLRTEATVAQAVLALRAYDGDPESVTEVYLLDDKRMLRGAVSLARLVMAQPETRLAVLAEPRVLSCPADMRQNDLAEMFDKYNLHALPVVDEAGRMVGVVQADHVISFLREKL